MDAGTTRTSQETETGVVRVGPSSDLPGGEGGGGEGAYITNLRRRQVDTYAVTEDELTSIDTQYWQAQALFAFASIATGSLLSAALTWDANGDWGVVGVLLVSAVGFLSVGSWIHRSRTSLLRRIKDQTMPLSRGHPTISDEGEA